MVMVTALVTVLVMVRVTVVITTKTVKMIVPDGLAYLNARKLRKLSDILQVRIFLLKSGKLQIDKYTSCRFSIDYF
jgi:hypothetical protein